MQELNKIELSSSTTSGTSINKKLFNNPLDLNSVYQSVDEIIAGAVSQLRELLPVWDENTLIVIAEQQVRGLVETLDRLKIHNGTAVYSIASVVGSYLEINQEPYVQMPPKLPSYPYSPGESRDETRSAQESTVLGSDSDIEQQVQSMRSKPQKGTKFLQMIGIVEERISPEND
jgi:hypothetical protein